MATMAEHAARRGLEPEDLLDLVFLGGIAIRPDGREAAFVRQTVDAKENRYRSQIWVTPLPPDEPAPRPFTAAGAHRDGQPAYSPSGRWLAFTSDRDGTSQVWVMSTSGGEAVKVTDVDGLDGFVWLDDDTLVLTVRVGPEGLRRPDPKDQPPPDARDEQDRHHNRDVRVIRRAFYKLDTAGFLGDKRSHLFLVSREGGDPTPLTNGDWDDGDAATSPDGRWIAFTSKRMPDADFVQANDLYVVAREGGEPRKLTNTEGFVWGPAFSPDGREIAFLFSRREDEGCYDNARLCVVPVDGSAPPRVVTEDYDRSLAEESIGDTRAHGGSASPVYSADGRTVYAISSDRGTSLLVAVDLASGRVTPISSRQRTLVGLAVAPRANRFAAIATEPAYPHDVWCGSLVGSLPDTRLTTVNSHLLDRVFVQEPERITFRAPGGPEIEGWTIRPVGYREGDLVPAVLEVHGGPEAMYTAGFFFEFQLLAARGFAVIFCNPRGSSGYGKAHRQAIHRDWGNLDWADVLALLDAAIARGFIDATRVGIAGGSYGGFMVNWAVGHTDRFRAAVSMRSISNWISDFGTGDFGYLDDDLFGTLPWRDPAAYLRMSPIAYVENVRTPLLLLHSEEDYRCPIEQAEQFYAALKKLGRTVELVRYPGESHELSRSGKPWHRIDRLRRIVAWFERYLKD